MYVLCVVNMCGMICVCIINMHTIVHRSIEYYYHSIAYYYCISYHHSRKPEYT